MTPLRPTRSTPLRRALLALLTVTALLTPAYARAAEREGAVLFFSLEDLHQALAHPSLPSLLALSPPSSSFAWRAQSGEAEQNGPLERNARYGNGLGIDGYTRPGTRPLWGY